MFMLIKEFITKENLSSFYNYCLLCFITNVRRIAKKEVNHSFLPLAASTLASLAINGELARRPVGAVVSW